MLWPRSSTEGNSVSLVLYIELALCQHLDQCECVNMGG